MNPFEFVKAINKGNDIMKTPLDEKDYNAFLVNRTMSRFADVIGIAHLMNRYHNLPSKLQFSFWLNTARAKSRFKKGSKKKPNHDLELVKEYFNYSDRKAREALNILTEEQVKHMRQKVNRRGKQKQ